MMVSKRNLLFQGLLFRFHVKFQGCIIKGCLYFWKTGKCQPSAFSARAASGHRDERGQGGPLTSRMPSDLWEVTEATTFLANKPMTRARFLELFRGCLVMMGVDFKAAQSATFNRLRRFLPTIENVLGMDPTELQANGNWVEVAQGGFQDPQHRKALRRF